MKINPSLIVQTVKENSYITFGLTYSYRTSLNRNIFENNSYCSLNDCLIFSLSNNTYFSFDGGNFEFSSEEIGNAVSKYSITSKTMLYSKEENSLWNYFKHFSSSSEISLDVIFKFEILNMSTFKNMTSGLSMEIFTSLGGK